MKKRIIIAAYVLLALFLAKLIFSNAYNEHVMGRYRRGDYSVNDTLLTYLNWPEPEVALYNNACLYFRRAQYPEAIESYSKALKYNLKPGKDCAVRIGLALSYVYSLGEDYALPANKDHSLEVLYQARDILLERGCANDTDTGHDADAQKLKDEIDAMIDMLENPPQSQSQDQQQKQDPNQNQNQNQNQDQNQGQDQDQSDPNQGDSQDQDQGGQDPDQNQNNQGGQSEEDRKEQELRQQLQQNSDNAYQEREQDRQQIEEWENGYNGNFGGRIW